MTDPKNISRAKDLRIGNWMLVPETDTMNEHYNKVVAISADEIRVSLYDNYGMGMSVDSIAPIPLTAEILIKAGFYELKGNNSAPAANAYILTLPFQGTDKNMIFAAIDNKEKNTSIARATIHDHLASNYNIEFVHQLQNIYYSLMGIELEIDLTKLDDKINPKTEIKPESTPSMFDSLIKTTDATIEAVFGKKK